MAEIEDYETAMRETLAEMGEEPPLMTSAEIVRNDPAMVATREVLDRKQMEWLAGWTEMFRFAYRSQAD